MLVVYLFALVSSFCFTSVYGEPGGDRYPDNRTYISNERSQEEGHQVYSKKLMYVGQRGTHTVGAYRRDGGLAFELTAAGLQVPFGIDIEDGNVFVVSQATNEIYAYIQEDRRCKTGPVELALLVPSGSGGLTKPFYTTLDDDLLYVSSHDSNEVIRYDAETGEFIDVAIVSGAGGLAGPRGLDFASDGNLYVASSLSNEVLVFNRDGEFLHVLAAGIPTPCGVAISRHDEVCVGSAGGMGVLCYDLDGREIYADPIGRVCGLDFGPRNELYTTRPDINAITVHNLRKGPPGEQFTTVQLPSGLSWGD